jgi:outer membrane protein assembly factor BamB
MQRELTFYPEIERTRDLLYSEYTSRDRSIHVLLQDHSRPQYRFLLEAYRDIVSRYLSTSRIQSSSVFLKELVGRLDELSITNPVTIDDFKQMGFYLLLRNPDAYYLLASREDEVFVHTGGESLTLSQIPGSVVQRVHFEGGTLQEELFPDSLKASFLVFKLDPEYFRDRDIVLGCCEGDKSTVTETLSDPLWLASGDRRNSLTSKFITRRVLVLRFDDAPAAGFESRLAAARGRRTLARPWGLALGVTAAVLVVIAGVWAGRTLLPANDRTAALERPAPAKDATADTEGDVAVPESTPEMVTRLAENWRKSYNDPVTSSPSLHGKWVIFGCRDGNVYALERETGETLWTLKTPLGIGASPLVFSGQVVVADYGGNVSAVDAQTGTSRWQRKLPDRVVSSPSATNDRLMVGCYDGYAYCLSLADGTTLWKRKTGGRIRASTAATAGKFFVASYDGYLYALAETTGEVEWRYQVRGSLASSPILYDDLVVIGAPDGAVLAVNKVDGSLRWKYQTDGAVKSSPVAEAGMVYVGSNDNHVYCLNLADGTLVWRYKTNNIVLSRPEVEDGVVYVGSYDGYMYGLDARTGELLDRFQSDGEIYSSPAVDANSVYFGNNKGSFISLNHRAKKAL